MLGQMLSNLEGENINLVSLHPVAHRNFHKNVANCVRFPDWFKNWNPIFSLAKNEAKRNKTQEHF